ncbi:MAG: YfhO family protein [Lentisphaerae bacterium]|nr:YfhO family protein [Lentisphaerota bacterium]
MTDSGTKSFAVSRKRWLSIALFTIPIAIATAIVYGDALFSSEWIASGDFLPVRGPDYQNQLWASFSGEWRSTVLGEGHWARPFHPLLLADILLPPRISSVVTFACSSIFLYLAAIYLLRGRGFRGASAWLPALWLAFSGYEFTLISAGHQLIFHMMPLAVFMLGCLDRAVRKQSPLHFGLAGLCAAWGMAAQPDIMGLFVLLGAAYGVVLLLEHWPRHDLAPFLRRMLLGGMLAAITIGVLGFPIWRHAQQIILPMRESSMGQTPDEKWIFASNWSMPPEDVVEFVAPNIYGTETSSRTHPYWGRLGQTYGWEETGRGFRNFRQHNVYIGAIPLMLTLYALFQLRRKKRLNDPSSPPPDTASRWTLSFWMAVFVLGLLLSFGRFFPLFRLFHGLPFFSQIRCPIKFMHIVDVAVAVLFAYGLQHFLSPPIEEPTQNAPGARDKIPLATADRSSRCDGRFTLLSASLTLAAFAAYALLPGFKAVLHTYWTRIGMEQQTELLLLNMRHAVAYAGLCFLICTVLFALKRSAPASRRLRRVLIGALLASLLMDVAVVCRPFVKRQNMSLFYSKSSLAQIISEDARRPRLSYRISDLRLGDPLWMNFLTHGVEILEPGPNAIVDKQVRKLFSTLNSQILRLWQLTSTGYIIGPTESLHPLLNSKLFSVSSFVDIDGRGLRQTDRGGSHVLLRYDAALPRAGLYYQWNVVPQERLPEQLADPQWNPDTTVILTEKQAPSTSQLPRDPVSISVYKSNRVEMNVDARAPAILMLNDKFDPDWTATVDGRKHPIIPCNYTMRGLQLAQGQHEVVFSYRPNRGGFSIGSAIAIALLLWAGGRLVATFRSGAIPQP